MQDKDKYIPGEEREDPPIGLYKIVKMDGGAPKIKFDDPFGESKKPEEPQQEEEAQTEEEEARQPPVEEKEIEFLRAERAVLEQMIQAVTSPLWEDMEDEDEDVEREWKTPAFYAFLWNTGGFYKKGLTFLLWYGMNEE